MFACLVGSWVLQAAAWHNDHLGLPPLLQLALLSLNPRELLKQWMLGGWSRPQPGVGKQPMLPYRNQIRGLAMRRTNPSIPTPNQLLCYKEEEERQNKALEEEDYDFKKLRITN